MTTLFEPFSPLFEFSRELDRMLSRSDIVRSYIPAADVVGTDEAVTVYVDLPGLSVDDIEIELVDGALTIRGERAYPYQTQTGENGAHGWMRLERGFGSFERTLQVPKGLDAEKITASIDNGVLMLHLPKPEEHKPRRIEITTSGTRESLTEGDGEEVKAEDREPVGAAA